MKIRCQSHISYLMVLLMTVSIPTNILGSGGLKGGDAATDIITCFGLCDENDNYFTIDNYLTIDGAVDRYNEGFNDALECIMLLNLELIHTNDRKTFREMNDICRQRFKVDKRE